MSKRFSALLVFGLGAAMVAVACSDGHHDSVGGKDSGAAQPDSSSPDGTTDGPAVADAQGDGFSSSDVIPDRGRDVSSPDAGPDLAAPFEVGHDQALADGERDLVSADAGRDPPDSRTADAQSPAEAGMSDSGTASASLLGRFDRTDPARPGFGWSGSAMIARFQGTGATLRIDGSPNQFALLVDGVLSPVLKVTSGTTQYAVASALLSGTHDVVVWKRTEGNQGSNRFLGFDVAGGQLLAPPATPDRRIEIYGDSITAGYGLDGQGPNCTFTPDTENHYLTYGALTARALGTELHTIAWSGIGMYRNYMVATASADAMPAVYARTLPDQAASVWAFDSWQPHAVVINLGTNDASNGDDPGTPFRTAYLDFVRTLRQKYPSTYFVLTIGPMLSGTSLAVIKGHLQAVIQTRLTEGDSQLSFLEFPVQTGSDGYGCDWHPNAATNAKMATLLTAELKTRLGW
jgi:lysophospholipase L1-like esterase